MSDGAIIYSRILLIAERDGDVSPENCQLFQEGSGTATPKIQHNIPYTL